MERVKSTKTCDTSKVFLREIPKSLAKKIIKKYHYSHSFSSCRYALGIFYRTGKEHKFFDEPEEKLHTPDTPDYAPDYTPDSPDYSPVTPGNNEDTDFTPKEQPIMDDDFKKIYIKKYPKSHFGEQEAAYRKFLETGDIIPHEQISEEDVKFGPSSDDFERWSSADMKGGKIELNIGNGENREKEDNLEKISEKNITFEGGSILQPVKIVNKEDIKRKSLLKKEINELKGEDPERDGDDEDNYDSNDNSSSSNGKKINFSLK